MSLQGPLVIVSEQAQAELIGALSAAGAFPIIETTPSEAAAAIVKISPAAVLIEGTCGAAAEAIDQALAGLPAPYVPVLARIDGPAARPIAGALPLAGGTGPAVVMARLACALRVRTLESTVLRRIEALRAGGSEIPQLPQGDPLDDATILVLGRGRNYPDLAVAVGERAGLIGALSIETAARCLNARDIDGIVIGDGFGPRMIEGLLTVIAEDSRFRDLPIAAVTGTAGVPDPTRLANMDLVAGAPRDVVAHILPLVRQHAHAAQLQRFIAALDTKGVVDPKTGLFTIPAFLRDLKSAVAAAEVRGGGLSIARISFADPISLRASLDAARLVSRMVRNVDFACRTSDGSVLIVFAETNLRSAHVVARRIASVIRHTLLSSDPNEARISPSVTIATLKAADTVESLIARIDEPHAAAV